MSTVENMHLKNEENSTVNFFSGLILKQDHSAGSAVIQDSGLETFKGCDQELRFEPMMFCVYEVIRAV